MTHYQTAGIYVTLTYARQFAAGVATGQLAHHLPDHKAWRAGQHVNWNAQLH